MENCYIHKETLNSIHHFAATGIWIWSHSVDGELTEKQVRSRFPEITDIEYMAGVKELRRLGLARGL